MRKVRSLSNNPRFVKGTKWYTYVNFITSNYLYRRKSAAIKNYLQSFNKKKKKNKIRATRGRLSPDFRREKSLMVRTVHDIFQTTPMSRILHNFTGQILKLNMVKMFCKRNATGVPFERLRGVIKKKEPLFERTMPCKTRGPWWSYIAHLSKQLCILTVEVSAKFTALRFLYKFYSPAPQRPCFFHAAWWLELKLERESPKEQFCQVILKSVQWFLTKRFLKCFI